MPKSLEFINRKKRHAEHRLKERDPRKAKVFYETSGGQVGYTEPGTPGQPYPPYEEPSPEPDFPDIPEVKRFTFENETVWTITHNFGNLPLVTIWKGAAIVHHGFGTQPFGTSAFGGGTFTEDAEEATDEPLIEETSLDEFTVTWTEATSGVVVVSSSGGEVTTVTTSWAEIINKPSTFTPSEHGNEAHSEEFVTEVDENVGFLWGLML